MLEFVERTLDLAGSRSHRSGDPVERPELVEDGALDPVHRIGLELDVAFRFELIDGVDEPKHSVRDQVRLFDVARQTHTHTASDELHQGRKVDDQAVTGILIG